MTNQRDDPEQDRVLVLAPTGRDGSLTCDILAQANIKSRSCKDIEELRLEYEAGAGAVILAEEALTTLTIQRLNEVLGKQPSWSDLPIILFAASMESAGILLNTFGKQGNVSILNRPISITIVISAVQSALRARRRQYQMRDLLLQMEEIDRQKDLFLATLSHELRTPLNSMVGWIHLLRQKKLNEADADRAIKTIERNAMTQNQLIADILDVSRIITGKFRLDVRPVEVRSLIEATIDAVRTAIEAKEIQLRVSLDPDAGEIVADANRIQQVLWNLLLNAIKFTPKAGRVEVWLQRAGSSIQIKVSDTGRGMKAEDLPFIFERFHQADSSSTRVYGGLGLGLSIVRHIVELHGGTVYAESRGEGLGATFTVNLPTVADHDPEDSPQLNTGQGHATQDNEVPSVEGLRVLLVEDDSDSREMMVKVLSNFGVEVTAVSSSPEALDSLKRFQPDVLVSDIGMPEEDGYTLIRKVRIIEQAEGRNNIPAMALSGYVGNDDYTKAISAGYQMHVAKPVETKQLLRSIAELAGRAAER